MGAAAAFRPLLDPSPGQEFPLHIGGAWCAAADDGQRDVVNPVTGAAHWRVAEAGPTDVARACETAQAAFPGWAASTSDTRAAALRALGGIIRDRMTDLAVLEAAVTGRPIREMRAQMARGSDGPPPRVVVTGGHAQASWAEAAWLQPAGELPAIADSLDHELVLRGLGLLAEHMAARPGSGARA